MSAEHFIDWSQAAPETVAPGVGVLLKRGAVVELGKITLAPGTELKEHAHPEEQFFYLLGGRLRYRVGEEERVVGPSELIFMPGGVPHWGKVEGEEPVVLIEIKQLKRA